MSNPALALVEPPDPRDDSDYEALRAVLAASARGRAFLAEHARRSRHADTAMLLAALARIESLLAEQRAREPAPAEPIAKPAAVPAATPASTALAAVAAQAIAAAGSDAPVVTVIKAGSRPPPAVFAGEDFRTAAEPQELEEPAEPAPPPEALSNVIADSVPPEHAAPPGTPVADALGALLALSEDERLALFS